MSGLNILKVARNQLKTMLARKVIDVDEHKPHCQVNDLVRSDPCLTANEITEETGISMDVCHEIITEKLEMHCVSSNFISKLLTQSERQLCGDLLGSFELFK